MLSSSLLNVFAQTNDNPYYSDDIDAAVQDAERYSNSAKNVGSRWYNRSTSKSFDFPKLLNKEMSSEIVDGALDATAAGPGDTAPERTSPLELNAEDVIANKHDDSELDFLADTKTSAIDLAIQPTDDAEEQPFLVYQIDKVEYTSVSFTGSSTDIRSEVTSRAYITPEF